MINSNKKLTIKKRCCVNECGCDKKQISKVNHSKLETNNPVNELTQPIFTIDFLYLDLSVCSRCQSTESTLEQSLREIKALLVSAGYNIVLNKIHIDTLEKAKQYQFVSSPTIRFNNHDIIAQLNESNCQDCGNLCGSEVNCRDWVFEGITYSEPPKALIIREMLREIYFPQSQEPNQNKYEVPQNLLKYFNRIV